MTSKHLIVDAHQDLAWNMLCFNRDYTRPVAETRRIEAGTDIPKWNDDTLLGWDAYQEGNVAVVFSTLFAAPERKKIGAWDTLTYSSTQEAHNQYRKQLDAYHRLVEEHPNKFALIYTQADLQEVLGKWEERENGSEPAVGLVVLMEAAEGVRSPAELEEWWQLGVRIIGLAWAGTRYSGGTNEPGPLTDAGFELLDVMAAHGFILDISHMDEEAVLQALDHYPGRIIASHANAKALLKGSESNRFLSDRVIEGLLERDGVIGVVPYNRFLKVGWNRGDDRALVPLESLFAHIDHICEIAGSARYAGIGSDADGGFGLQSAPAGIDTIADLQKLSGLMEIKGYTQEDIAAILGGNWLRVLSEGLPETS